MKTILSISFLFFCVALSAQEIISEDREFILRDTSYFLVTKITSENGTPFPNVDIDTTYVGDSTTIANTLFDEGVQPMLRVAEGMQLALRRQQATQLFNDASALFNSLTGTPLIPETGRRFFGSLQGRYRVFDQAGNSFFANITQVSNNTLRLVEEPGGGDGVWVVQALGPNAFRLINFDHDADGNTDNWWFFWDGISSERKMYWPTERITGETNIFRIVKIE